MIKLNDNSTRTRLWTILSSDWPALILITGSLITSFLVYPYMPEQVPAHWNLQGEVDNYTSRFWGTFGPPLFIAGIYFMMAFLPLIDPKRHNYAKFPQAFRAFKLVFVLFLVGVYTLTIFYSLGYQVSINRLVPLGVSLLFIVIGNYMGQIRHNYFFGIKTPWTLASEDVWRKTHRLGAKVWVIAGFSGAAGALINGKLGLVIMVTALVVATILPLIYSFIIYKRKE